MLGAMSVASSEVVVYIFSSKTCAPCQAMKPVFAEMKEDYSDYQWMSVDVNKNPELTASLGVRNIPCMVVVKGDDMVGRHVGTDIAPYFRILRAAKQ